LVIGMIELLQVAINMLGWHGPRLDALASLDFGVLGYIIVGMFLVAWGASVLYWRFGRVEDRVTVACTSYSREE